MDYIPRPGIVCASICGRRVLIPSRQASDACRSIFQLYGPYNVVWNGIEKDLPLEKVLEVYAIFSKLDPEEQKRRIENCCQKLLEAGFILPKPESFEQ